MQIIKIKILTGDAWYYERVGEEFYIDIDEKYDLTYKEVTNIDDYYVAVVKDEHKESGIKLGHSNYKQVIRKLKLEKIND